jgi:hypothetical protein
MKILWRLRELKRKAPVRGWWDWSLWEPKRAIATFG